MSEWPVQKIQEVADGIFTVVHGQGEVGVANASFIIEQKRTLVVDTMTFPAMAVHMADEIARRGGHVETVLNTHHHIDHMGGNQVFAEAHLLAHAASIDAVQKLGVPVAVYRHLMPQFQDRFVDGMELVTPAPLPEYFWLPHGGELMAFTPAHTPADVAVWFPQSRVLIAGDTCFIGVVPLAVNGLISGWIKALDTLIALKPEVVVPGHGPIGTLADLRILREYFSTLQRLGRQAVQEKLTVQEALAFFDPGPLQGWIEAERHAINLERVMQEERGEISPTDLSAFPMSARHAQKH
jgi:glyoxylase-like metal-dependent hydrolase (beta-lactamase superfamily II)